MNFNICNPLIDEKIVEILTKKTCTLFEKEYKIKIDESMVDIQTLNDSKILYKINLLTMLSGEQDINLTFSFEKTLAKFLLDSFPYISYSQDEEEEMIFEIVGEFLNIVVGRLIAELKAFGINSFSTPTELFGNNKFILNKKIKACVVKLTTKYGAMMIIISMKKD